MALYTAEQLKNWEVQTCHHRKNEDGTTTPIWCQTRPINYRFDGLARRLKLTWYVFIGRYDALDWEDNACHRLNGCSKKRR